MFKLYIYYIVCIYIYILYSFLLVYLEIFFRLDLVHLRVEQVVGNHVLDEI